MICYLGTLGGFAYARGLSLSTHARGLSLSTHARGLRLRSGAQPLDPRSGAQPFDPRSGASPTLGGSAFRPTLGGFAYARGLSFPTHARGLDSSTHTGELRSLNINSSTAFSQPTLESSAFPATDEEDIYTQIESTNTATRLVHGAAAPWFALCRSLSTTICRAIQSAVLLQAA
jgi:hypothetical protein